MKTDKTEDWLAQLFNEAKRTEPIFSQMYFVQMVLWRLNRQRVTYFQIISYFLITIVLMAIAIKIVAEDIIKLWAYFQSLPFSQSLLSLFLFGTFGAITMWFFVEKKS